MTAPKGSILLVEDSPTQAERVRLLLDLEGYRVEVARNGREGLERARAAAPDLIIADIVMPEMDGYAFCQAIRQSKATRRIPFIFFTERHAPMDIIEGLLRGADNFIPKSSSDEYLLARVRRIFQQLEHRKEGEVAIEILVRVDDREIPISADKQQIFELLVSSVEEAAHANEELHEAQRLLQEHARQLDNRVQERTQDLAAAEEKYRTLVDTLHEGIWAVDTEARTTYVNPRMAEMLGYTVAEMTGRPLFDFIDATGVEFAKAALERRRQGIAEGRAVEFLRRDGGTIHTLVEACPILDMQGAYAGALGAVRDVTEARRAEERIRHLNRMYRTISEINQLIVRERDRQSLLSAACRILVEKGEFRLAWVGVPDIETGRLRPVAAAGATEFLDGVEFRIDDSPQGRGPHGRAYRDGAAVAVVQDWASDASVAPWRERGLGLGIRSSAAAPIVQGHDLFGVLNVDAGAPNAFDGEVLGLLTELAGDLGFALLGIGESERRAEAVRATRQSEERLRALASATFEGIAFTVDGLHVDVNEQYAAMFGYESDELRGKPVVDLVAPQSRQQVAAKVRDNAVDAGEYLALRKDGTVFPIEVRLRRMTRQDRPVMVAAVWDITERKRTEQALLEHKEQLSLAMDAAALGTWHRDLASGQVAWSDRAYAILGREPGSAVTFADFLASVYPEDRGRLEAAVQETPSGATWEAECRIRWRDGTEHWVAATGRTCLDPRGQPIRTVGVVQEITARKQAEEALRASERKYKHFFEQDLAGHYVSTPDGRLIACNSAFARILGFRSAEEAMGARMASLYATPEARRAFLGRLKTNGRVDRLEVELHRKDLTPVQVIESAAAVTDDRGELCEIHGFLIDDTERRNVEAEFRQAQKMEAVGRLAGGVAHDFNNLLGVILGYAELLERRLAPGDSQRAKIEQIRKATERGASLTHQLLAFSRKQVLKPRVLDLNHLVREMEPMLRRLIGEDVELVTLLPEELEQVMADDGQIQQVLMNLAVNARDAMPRGGRLTLETATREATTGYLAQHPGVAPGPYVVLSVSDTGQGMDAETRAHIFEPFFTTKEAGKGTGLGLATVYGVVQQSGGHIEVESEPGEGATFKIWLPMIEGAAQPTRAPVSQASLPGGSDTILLLEDDEALRLVAQEILEEAGYDVLAAAGPEEALATALAHPGQIDLLVSDVVMPGMSGPDLAARLGALKPQIKVLYMSGYTDEGVARTSIIDAGSRLLQKPFTSEDMLREIRAALDETVPTAAG